MKFDTALFDLLNKLPVEVQEIIIGKKTGNPLLYSFTKKRTVQLSVKHKTGNPTYANAEWRKLFNKPARQNTTNVYIHIPFCRNRCSFCSHFYNFCNDRQETAYVEALVNEITASKGSPYWQESKVQSVYIGGGTPGSLSCANMRRLLQTITECLPLSPNYELTVEARINDFGSDKLAICLSEGVNRLSFGVQSFNTSVRSKIGRIDSKETVISRLNEITASGTVTAIDLIFGLPWQTNRLWSEDIAALRHTNIDALTLYQLVVPPDSPLAFSASQGSIPSPATLTEQAQLFQYSVETLTDKNYTRLNTNHWALTAKERNLYNNAYKTGSDIIPFGSGATGIIQGTSFVLENTLTKYLADVASGSKPIKTVAIPGAQHQLYYNIITSLDLGRLDIETIAAANHYDLTFLVPLLSLWEKRGLLSFQGSTAVLTIAGQFWAANLTQSLLDMIDLYFGFSGLSKQELVSVC